MGHLYHGYVSHNQRASEVRKLLVIGSDGIWMNIAYGSMDPMDPKPRLISAADRATSRGFHTKFGAVRRQAAHFLTKQERKSCQIAESVWLIIQSEST